jgi:hypothetical protein
MDIVAVQNGPVEVVQRQVGHVYLGHNRKNLK